MSSTTKIEWSEQSWNPIIGCNLKSPGCTNCYAMPMAARLAAMGHASYQGLTQQAKTGAVWTGKLALNEKALIAPLKRKKPTTYFVNSMGDLFHENVPDDWIDRVFAVMALCPQHTFQVLTKRSGRMREYTTKVWGDHRDEIARTTTAVNDVFRLAGHRGNWGRCGSTSTSITTVSAATGAREYAMLRRLPDGGVERFYWHNGQETWTRCSDAYAERVPRFGAHTGEFGWGLKEWPLPNVWLGVSVEDQTRANERIPDLLATPAAVRWLSCEPLLGPVDLLRVAYPKIEYETGIHYLDVLRAGYWSPKGKSPFFRPAQPDEEQGFFTNHSDLGRIDWVVCGGESGKDARPMHPDWARQLRDQCAAADVPFFFKQWGEWVPAEFADEPFIQFQDGRYIDGHLLPDADDDPKWTYDWSNDEYEGHCLFEKVGKKAAGRTLDGIEHNGMPKAARIAEAAAR